MFSHTRKLGFYRLLSISLQSLGNLSSKSFLQKDCSDIFEGTIYFTYKLCITVYIGIYRFQICFIWGYFSGIFGNYRQQGILDMTGILLSPIWVLAGDDDLITAVYIQPTARPAPSPPSPPGSVTYRQPLECDDEDCLDGGSGAGAPSRVPTPPSTDDDDDSDGEDHEPSSTQRQPSTSTVTHRATSPPVISSTRHEWSIVRTFTVTRAPWQPRTTQVCWRCGFSGFTTCSVRSLVFYKSGRRPSFAYRSRHAMFFLVCRARTYSDSLKFESRYGGVVAPTWLNSPPGLAPTLD